MNVPQEKGYELIKKGEEEGFSFKEVEEPRWVKEGSICFEGFSVKYSPDLETVLSGINVRIGKG